MPPDAQIHDIELLVHFHELLTGNVESLGGVKDEGLCQNLDIVCNRVLRYLSAGGGDIVRDALVGDRTSHAPGQELCNGLQKRDVCHLSFVGVRFPSPLPVFDILDDDGVVDPLQVHIGFFLGAVHGGDVGKSAVLQKSGKQGVLVTAVLQLAVFPEGKREDGDLHIAARQQRRQLSGEHESIGPSDIEIHILFDVKTVHDLFKGRYFLHLIQKDIGGLIRAEPIQQIPIELLIIQQLLVFQLFKIQGHDLPVLNANGSQMLLILHQQRGLTAASNAGNDLDHLFVLPERQLLQILRALDHTYPS